MLARITGLVRKQPVQTPEPDLVQFVYASDLPPPTSATEATPPSPPLSNIYEATKKSLNKLADAQAKIGLQDPQTSVAIQQCVDIAKLLINANGIIDFSKISDIIANLLTGKDSYSKTAKKMLVTFQEHQDDTQSFVTNLQAPKEGSGKAQCEEAIRATLRLSPSKSITGREAALCAFVYLLCNPRQDDSGSCFGSCVQILQHKKFILLLQDVKSMVEEGAIFRVVDNQQKIYPATQFFYSPTLLNEVILSAEGNVVSDDTLINTAPGIIYALEAMGIPNSSENLTQVMTMLLPEGTGEITVSAARLIEAYSQMTEDSKTADSQKISGWNGYSAYALCAIQMRMLSAIGGLSYKVGPLINDLIYSINTVVFEGMQDCEGIKKSLMETIRNQCPYIWDIDFNKIDENTPIYSVGRFQLYHHKNSEFIRMNNEEDYKNMVFELLNLVASQQPDGPNKELFEQRIEELSNNPATIQNLIDEYTKLYKEWAHYYPDPAQHLPWRNLACKSSPVFFPEFFGVSPKPSTEFTKCSPANSNDLIDFLIPLINGSKNNNDTIPTGWIGALHGKFGDSSIGHLFTWTLRSRTLLNLIESVAKGSTIEVAIDTAVGVPGREVGDQEINLKIKKEIIDNLLKQLEEKFKGKTSADCEKNSDPIRTALREDQNQAAELILKHRDSIQNIVSEKEKDTYYTFSSGIYNEIVKLLPSSVENSYVNLAIAGFLDEAIRSVLNDEDLSKLLNPPICLANSNWFIGNDDILFANGWSVTLGTTTLFSITENSKNILNYYPAEGVEFRFYNQLMIDEVAPPQQFTYQPPKIEEPKKKTSFFGLW